MGNKYGTSANKSNRRSRNLINREVSVTISWAANWQANPNPARMGTACVPERS